MIATIDTARAARAREIYESALREPAALSQSNDNAEWKALEAEREQFDRNTPCGVKFSNTPHKQSAYPELPMRGAILSFPPDLSDKRRAIALWPEPKREKFRSLVSGKVVKDAKCIISKTKAHPQSSYSHLPLSGLGLGADKQSDLLFFDLPPIPRYGLDRKLKATCKWALTAADRQILAARPLKYTAG